LNGCGGRHNFAPANDSLQFSGVGLRDAKTKVQDTNPNGAATKKCGGSPQHPSVTLTCRPLHWPAFAGGPASPKPLASHSAVPLGKHCARLSQIRWGSTNIASTIVRSRLPMQSNGIVAAEWQNSNSKARLMFVDGGDKKPDAGCGNGFRLSDRTARCR